MKPAVWILVPTLLGASACASDTLVFTTYTKVGLDVSGTGGTPTEAVFGYKRFEGAVVPVDPSADPNEAPEMPALWATMDLENKWFGGLCIRQSFATGAAAVLVAGDANHPGAETCDE